jgi:hypothetical protein
MHSYVRITIPNFLSCNLRILLHNYEGGTSNLVYLIIYVLAIPPEEGLKHAAEDIWMHSVQSVTFAPIINMDVD